MSHPLDIIARLASPLGSAIGNYPYYELGFEVWITGETCSYPVASFQFWQECLDYKDYCLKRGKPCMIRTMQPNGTWRAEWRHPAGSKYQGTLHGIEVQS